MARRANKRIQQHAYQYLTEKGPDLTANIKGFINNDLMTNIGRPHLAQKKAFVSVSSNQLGSIMKGSPLFRHAQDQHGQELDRVAKINSGGGTDLAWLWEALDLEEVREIIKDKPRQIARLPFSIRKEIQEME